MLFPGLWRRGFNWTVCSALLPGFDRRSDLRGGICAFSKKAGCENHWRVEGNRLRCEGRPRRTERGFGGRPSPQDRRDPRHRAHPLGRSMLDLFPHAAGSAGLECLAGCQTGLQFDLRSAQGKLIASLMAVLAEFERDLLRERVRSGIAARKRGVVFGGRPCGPADQSRSICTQGA